jgi:hypothetical protein
MCSPRYSPYFIRLAVSPSVLLSSATRLADDWPELLPVERIRPGIAELVLGLFLFAGLVAFGRFLF